MRKNFGPKSAMFPMPVLVIGTYDKQERPNAMVGVWGGISHENQISICISASHKTTANILEKKAFTVSAGDARHVKECDFVGLVSGNKDPDKLKKAGFTVEKSTYVDAPVIQELPFCLECKLISYDSVSCNLVGQIVNASIDESCLTDGKVDLAKVAPLSYDPFNFNYNVLGPKVGTAFKDGKTLIEGKA